MAGPARKRRHGLVHTKPKHGAPALRSEINVTPLVDVCLVLLIIFMVIMPLLARGKEVPLPKTKVHSEEADKSQPIVAIARDGKIYFDKDVVAQVVPVKQMVTSEYVPQWQVDKPDDLKKRLEDAWKRLEERAANDKAFEFGGRKVFFKADPDLQYGQVYPVIMAINELGISTIDLGTHEQKEGGVPAQP